MSVSIHLIAFIVLLIAALATAHAAVESLFPAARRDMIVSSVLFGVAAAFSLIAALL